MPILLRILLNFGRLTVALFLLLTNGARLREELTLEQFERVESFRAEREAAARPLSKEAFEAAFEEADGEAGGQVPGQGGQGGGGEHLSVDTFWAMVFQRPYGGLGWRLTPVRECLAQMAEPGLAYIQRPCYRRLQELQSGGHTSSSSSSGSKTSSEELLSSLQSRPLELLLFYRCFMGGVVGAGYELHNATLTAVRREENYVISFFYPTEAQTTSSKAPCSPFWLHEHDGFSVLDSPPVLIHPHEKSVAALRVKKENGLEQEEEEDQDQEEEEEVAILLKDDAADPGKLRPLAEPGNTDYRGCLLTGLQPGSGLISGRCADLVKEKL